MAYKYLQTWKKMENSETICDFYLFLPSNKNKDFNL